MPPQRGDLGLCWAPAPTEAEVGRPRICSCRWHRHGDTHGCPGLRPGMGGRKGAVARSLEWPGTIRPLQSH